MGNFWGNWASLISTIWSHSQQPIIIFRTDIVDALDSTQALWHSWFHIKDPQFESRQSQLLEQLYANYIFLNVPIPASYSFFRSFKQTIQYLQQINVKMSIQYTAP